MNHKIMKKANNRWIVNYFFFPLLMLLFYSVPCPGSGRSVPEDDGWHRGRGWLRGGEINLAARASEQTDAGKLRAAARTYRRMANLATSPANAAWATIKTAEVQLADNRLEAAAESFQEAIEKWPGYIDFNQTMASLREIAEIFATEKGRSLWIIPITRTRQAIDIYQFMVAKAPSGRQAANDQMRLGQLQLKIRQSEQAMKTFQAVFTRHPRSEVAPAARIAYVNLLLTTAQRQHDQPAILHLAIRETQHFIRFHPEHELAPKARTMMHDSLQRLADHYFELAEFYLHPVRYNATIARRYLQKVIDLDDGTEAASKARQKLHELEVTSQDSPNSQSGQGHAGITEPNPSRATRNSASLPDPPVLSYTPDNPAAGGISRKPLLPPEMAPLGDFSSLAVAAISNPTRESELGTVLQRQLHEQIALEETISLQTRKKADLLLEVRIDDFQYQASGSAQIRDEQATPSGLTTHATTLYTAYLDLSYRVLDNQREPRLEWQTMRGQADFPQMPDMSMARTAAIRQASTDAAGKVVASLVESW